MIDGETLTGRISSAEELRVGSAVVSGPRGYSAYEVYINEGGTLTEKEWLESLKGETGPQGPQGEQGIQGPKGDKGDAGTTDYNALENKPNIPNKTSDLTNDDNFQNKSQVDSAIASAIGGITGFDYEIVETLPTTGRKGIIYLVPAEVAKEQNVYYEYIWLEDKFELIGSTQVDLTGYIKDTDYATDNKGGTIKTGYGTVASDGKIMAIEQSYDTYKNSSVNTFISKGTLDNVLLAKGYITEEKEVVVSTEEPTYGKIWINSTESNMRYNDNGVWEKIQAEVTGDTLPIGAMMPFGGINAPAGWLICDGSEVSRTTYSELFAVIGTSYGAGDGSTTFNLPNKKGKVSVGLDTSDTDFNTIGKTGGSKYLQEHSHILDITTYTQPGGLGFGDKIYNITANDVVEKTYIPTTRNAGTGDSGNLQPFEVDQWIIKASQTAGLVASVVNTPSTSDKDTYSCDYINSIGSSLNTIIENKYSTSWWNTTNKIKSNFVLIDLRSNSENDNVSLYLPVALLKKYSSASPYFIKNYSNLIFQCYISSDGIFRGLNRAEAGANYVANIYEVN